MAARYTFGDDDPAVERMALVARAYEPVSATFIAEHAPRHVGTVLDLGCGPGFSTALLHRLVAPQRLVGVDASAQFLDVARASTPTAHFVQHDATRSPLPDAPCDLIYARLLLAHLPDPPAVVERWRTNLNLHGVLLVEDLEDIETDDSRLRAYDQLSAEIVRSGGGVMYAGALLAELGGRTVPVTVPAALAATIYLVNVRRWLADGSVADRQRLLDVEQGLEAVTQADDDDDRHTLSWIVRQVVLPAIG